MICLRKCHEVLNWFLVVGYPTSWGSHHLWFWWRHYDVIMKFSHFHRNIACNMSKKRYLNRTYRFCLNRGEIRQVAHHECLMMTSYGVYCQYILIIASFVCVLSVWSVHSSHKGHPRSPKVIEVTKGHRGHQRSPEVKKVIKVKNAFLSEILPLFRVFMTLVTSFP